MEFKVSVIIPVYNARAYVAQAVESAVHLHEVGEIILVEDGSPDNALEECIRLAGLYAKVKLLQHERGANQGAGPSRNLGIRNAMCEFISFLDADDYYLEDRFQADKERFQDPTVEGVYSAAAYLIDSPYASERVSKRYKTSDPAGYLYTVREAIDPGDLFYYLLNGGKGHFCTNNITVRKSVFQKVGYFVSLRLHQDTNMWLRLALNCKLVAGEITRPVSMIRVHLENRIRTSSRDTVSTYYRQIYYDLSKIVRSKREYSTLIKKKVGSRARFFKKKKYNRPLIAGFLLMHFIKHPGDLFRIDVRYLFK